MTQVDPSHYTFLSYDNPARFASYFQQIASILRSGGTSVLEIGAGGGFMRRNLVDHSISVTTVDFDGALAPDIVGDVRNLPVGARQFDVVCAFQVLEHLPWTEVGAAIREMKRCASMAVLVSVPDSGPYIQIQARLPFLGTRRWRLELDRVWQRKHTFDGQHYWEVGTAGHSKHRVRQTFECAEWVLEETVRLFANPYHRFYMLKRRNACQ
jgi:SAM-dependent methyltransferase